jgi:hypothetical protein
MDVTEHEILARTTHPTSLSQPADFTLGPGRAVPLNRVYERDVSPYCFDLSNRLLLCVSTPDIAGSTFFYQAQRRRARTVLRVPVDELPDASASPALIFSIGRCGSTLLFRAFEAAGVAIVSEPDYFTQAALAGIHDRFLQVAIGRATRLLPYAAIKLRLECNAAPLLIAGAFRAPRVVFVLRDAVDWASSHHRQSRGTIGAAQWTTVLKGSLFALAQLAQVYDVRVAYYEDFRTLDPGPIAALLASCGFTDRVDAAALRAVAERDSHEGSDEPGVPADVVDTAAFREVFAREWAAARPADLIARLRLRGV